MNKLVAQFTHPKQCTNLYYRVLSVDLSVYLTFCLSINVSVDQCICLSICLFIYMSA